ncbi:hypothetical protein RDWZM_003139 [Blomia tropicalis]|uniref:Uncharacterized protein n=1 Tax=Blomia tropicalis TaxID=40697 RepID=A0A9Q0MF06_BLOTA|nr:hypothetical protein RDWZM_003139 [Blomia tropicalis]
MRLPSGTRICLLAAFGFLLITTEFPEFSRISQGTRKLANIDSGEVSEFDGELGNEIVADGYIGGQSSILVEAIFFKGYYGGGYRHRRHYGWGHRRYGHYGWGRRRWGHHRRWGGGYRRCCYGK